MARSRLLGEFMLKKIAFAAVALSLLGVACGKEGTLASRVTVQIDGKSDAFNFLAIAFFPDVITVHAGDTVKFQSNFRGEPHTVALGTKIDQGMAIFDKLTPQQKQEQGPPPAAYTRL